MGLIADNYQTLSGRIARAATAAGRDPDEILMVAVSKTVPPERIREAFAAGVRAFGENRAQELRDKSAALAALPIAWHFIGALQSNKVRYVTPLCDLVHSVDRIELARAISQRATPDHPQRLLVQVNTTAEETKSGVSPEGLPVLLDEISGLPHLAVEGLMTIGPLAGGEREIRASFQLLRGMLARESAVARPNVSLRHLSMGMSGDFEIAIAEGATILRIGTALFGGRD